MRSDSRSAGTRYAGIPVDRRVALVYILSGVFSALAALIYVARVGQAKADAGTGYELPPSPRSSLRLDLWRHWHRPWHPFGSRPGRPGETASLCLTCRASLQEFLPASSCSACSLVRPDQPFPPAQTGGSKARRRSATLNLRPKVNPIISNRYIESSITTHHIQSYEKLLTALLSVSVVLGAAGTSSAVRQTSNYCHDAKEQRQCLLHFFAAKARNKPLKSSA